jgi:hypothetical protein
MFSIVPHLWEWGLIDHPSDEKYLFVYCLQFFWEISIVQKRVLKSVG